MEPTPVTPPAISPQNITGSPASTYAGVAILTSTIGQMMMTQAQPQTTAQWIMFGSALLGGVLSMFARGGSSK